MDKKSIKEIYQVCINLAKQADAEAKASENGQPSPAVIEALKKLNPDFFVTFAFGQILSQEVLDIPKYETINLHASMLPKYRGANPIQRVIIDGEKETGICTMITELGLDCGDVCMREKIEIDPKNPKYLKVMWGIGYKIEKIREVH